MIRHPKKTKISEREYVDRNLSFFSADNINTVWCLKVCEEPGASVVSVDLNVDATYTVRYEIDKAAESGYPSLWVDTNNHPGGRGTNGLMFNRDVLNPLYMAYTKDNNTAYIALSSSGREWSTSAVDVSESINKVAYGSSTWVLVGQDKGGLNKGRILTSNNGVSFTNPIPAFAGNNNHVAFGKDRFIVASDDGLQASDDLGATWKAMPSAVGKFTCIGTDEGGVWAAVNSDKEVWMSLDNGDTWSIGSTLNLLPSAVVKEILWSSVYEAWALVGGNSVSTSVDLVNWELRLWAPGLTIYSMDYANSGMFIAGGSRGFVGRSYVRETAWRSEPVFTNRPIVGVATGFNEIVAITDMTVFVGSV